MASYQKIKFCGLTAANSIRKTYISGSIYDQCPKQFDLSILKSLNSVSQTVFEIFYCIALPRIIFLVDRSYNFILKL